MLFFFKAAAISVRPLGTVSNIEDSPDSKPEIEEIAEKMLENLKNRLDNLNITIKWEDSVKSALADKGFDEVYGARPLRREIQNKIEDAISENEMCTKIINGIDYMIVSSEIGSYKLYTLNKSLQEQQHQSKSKKKLQKKRLKIFKKKWLRLSKHRILKEPQLSEMK